MWRVLRTQLCPCPLRPSSSSYSWWHASACRLFRPFAAIATHQLLQRVSLRLVYFLRVNLFGVALRERFRLRSEIHNAIGLAQRDAHLEPRNRSGAGAICVLLFVERGLRSSCAGVVALVINKPGAEQQHDAKDERSDPF